MNIRIITIELQNALVLHQHILIIIKILFISLQPHTYTITTQMFQTRNG